MIKRKKKLCIGCNTTQYIFAKSLCNFCYAKQPKKTPVKKQNKPIAKFSKKHLEKLKEYRILRDKFLKENPYCKKCGGLSTDLHHRKTRIGTYLTDTRYFYAMCRSCHIWVHENDKESREQGYLLSKF